MSKGLQFYPGASTAYRYDGTYPGLMQEINCCVTHTTEGTSLVSYGGGASAPNTTLLPDIKAKKLKAYCHFPADMSARALVDNPNTAVRTNRNNCHQVELVGSCDPRRRTSWGTLKAGVDYIYWPEAPDWALREYAKYVAWLYTEHGVPLTLTKRPFLPYPDSFGSSRGQRMTLDEWAGFKGHCGHMHVPDGNDHGDPGNMRMDLVIQYAKEIVAGGPGTPGSPTPTPPEEDMALNADDVRKIWETDGILSSPDYDKDPNGDLHWPAESYLRNTYLAARETRERVKSLTATGLTDAQIDAIAEKVADKLAARLAE